MTATARHTSPPGQGDRHGTFSWMSHILVVLSWPGRAIRGRIATARHDDDHLPRGRQEDRPMSGIRTASTARPWTGAAFVALLLALLDAAACGAPKVTKRQTDIMEKAGTVSVSAAVLRVGVNDLVDRFAGRIEQSADRIVEQTDTPAIRQRALALKTNAIPMVYTAGFRADPLSAAVDVWVLAFQFREYAQSAAGRAAFGPQLPLLRETALAQLADVDAVMRAVAIKPEHFDR